MEYPVWELNFIGGSSLLAFICIIHVYVAHFAVGGGLFIWLTDLKSYREKNVYLNDYLRRYNWFFLLLTMVFGAVTGVGIWFSIGAVSPAATSVLIRYFAFAWATEWTCFLGEIIALLVYHYYFDKLQRKDRVTIAFLYFIFAWLSLLIVNGILSFMLTPGKWIATHNIWDGFFNPTFVSSTVFRSFASFMFAGIFGYTTIVFTSKSDFRTWMLRNLTKWLLLPMIGLILSAVWYFFLLPADIRAITFRLNPETAAFTNILAVTTILIFTGGALISRRQHIAVQKTIAISLIIIGLFWMGAFEYIREISRKPFVLNQYMYSTSILKTDIAKLNKEGILKNARWVSVKEITPENRTLAGKEIFNIECLCCHTSGGIKNDILKRTKTFTYPGMMSMLTGQGKVKSYMPPFAGTGKEKEALAAYIIEGLHKKTIDALPEPVNITRLKNETIAQFNPLTDEYVLLAWSNPGIYTVSDSDAFFVLLPPASTLEALLIKRGKNPEIITSGVSISYKAANEFMNPSKNVRFWDFAGKIFGTDIKKDIGITGSGMSGSLLYDDKSSSFKAENIPVIPYNDSGQYNPYPVFNIEARNESGKLLAETKAVITASTEMGCRNCHGGAWRWKNISGISDETASNILYVHDYSKKTALLKQAKKGRPVLCQSCHSDALLHANGKAGVPGMSAAIHGFHASLIPLNGEAACMLCHPSNPKGNTRFNRGIHNAAGLSCIDCHGTLSDHSIALLKAEKNEKYASRVLNSLEAVMGKNRQDIKARIPWVNEPDCLSCHNNFQKPAKGIAAFNKWTKEPGELYRLRGDNMGIRCQACHNSTHAEYPAKNPYNPARDNMIPLQYAKMPYCIGANRSCAVCHKEPKQESMHHDNMLHMMRRQYP